MRPIIADVSWSVCLFVSADHDREPYKNPIEVPFGERTRFGPSEHKNLAWDRILQGRVGFYRAMLCIRGTSHGPVSVCLCLCLPQAGVLLKRQNVGLHKQHHTMPKISAKFDRGHPLRGRRMQVGWSKSATFDKLPAISRKR